jgi:hypothetical protein
MVPLSWRVRGQRPFLVRQDLQKPDSTSGSFVWQLPFGSK